MGHEFIKRHACGHLYNANGIGEREIDLTPFIGEDYSVAESFKLPGFEDTERNVTYKSHTFWFHFVKWNFAKTTKNYAKVFVVVHHGAGWEVWEGDRMLAMALFAFVGKGESTYRPAFLLAWSLIEIAESAFVAGFSQARDTYQQAFADGRLKKKKVRGLPKVKVWIEDKK